MAHVSDVDDVGYVHSLPQQGAAECVGEHIGAQIAQMGIVVDGRAAAVDAGMVRVDRGERIDRARQAVEEAQGRVAMLLVGGELVAHEAQPWGGSRRSSTGDDVALSAAPPRNKLLLWVRSLARAWFCTDIARAGRAPLADGF